MTLTSIPKRLVGQPSPAQWVAGSAVANLTAVFLTTLLVSRFLDATAWPERILYLAGAILLLIVNGAITGSLTLIRESRFPQHPDIVLTMTRAVSAAMAEENELQKSYTNPTVLELQQRSIAGVKIYLKSLENVLSGAWSEMRFGGTRNVEVVLMKKASDGNVTIGSWGRRRPRSLGKRLQNPTFYDRTEAAKLYREFHDIGNRVPLHIIPDISSHPDYDHFGRDSKLRTSSTALFPVYDLESKLLGFIAITARQGGLFVESDRKFWNEAWTLWEQHFVRQILMHESTGVTLEEERTLPALETESVTQSLETPEDQQSAEGQEAAE